MRHYFAPEIGMWFKNLEYPSTFEVVATDESEGYVEIQHFSGEIEEIDMETWFELDLDPVPAPDDWTGPYELSKEDYGYYDDFSRQDDWNNPLTDIDFDKYD